MKQENIDLVRDIIKKIDTAEIYFKSIKDADRLEFSTATKRHFISLDMSPDLFNISKVAVLNEMQEHILSLRWQLNKL